MAIVLTLGREVMRRYVRVRHQAEDQTQRKFVFMMKWQKSGTWEVLVKSFLRGISMDMWGNVLRVLKVYTGGMVLGKKCRRLLEFCDEKELCASNTCFYKAGKRKITYSAGGCGTEIDFVLVGKKYKKYVRDVKLIPCELQHKLVVVDQKKRF